MAQMELDYAQFVVENDPDDIRCVLTTDAKSAFQSASRSNCYKVLCTEDTLRERFAPFFAHAHKGSHRIILLAANMTLKPSYLDSLKEMSTHRSYSLAIPHR